MGHGRFINEDSAPVNWNSLRSYENYLNDSYTFKETKSPNPAQKFPCIAEKCSRNSPDLPIQDNDVEELQVLVDNLNKYAAENSVLYERCKLFSLKQKIEESFEQFVSELISQAQKCMLGGLIDDLVKCMIILGVRDDRMKEKLLQDDGLSLKKAVETCLQMEKNKHCLARALYDNIPDTPDELHFRRGDTLIVLEQNTANIEGWWLCSLRGKQTHGNIDKVIPDIIIGGDNLSKIRTAYLVVDTGICPANRLRLIPGVFEDVGRGSSPHHFSDNGDIIYLQRQGKRRSWHVHPNQVVTPKKFNDVYLYDMPPSKCSPNPVSGLSPGMSPREPPNDCYDTPPPAVRVANDSFRNCPRCSPAPSCASPINRDSGEAYDVPRSLIGNPNQLTPSSSASSLTADSLSSSNRSSLANMPDYDVPKPHTRGPQIVLQPPQHYDVPSQLTKELPLELNSALENLERLQTDTTSAISKLLGFVGHQWRTKERLESNLMEIRLSVTRLRSSLHDLAEFGEGTLGNAARASDKNLAGKLAPLVSALKRSNILVQEASEKLAKHNWSLELLARPAEEEKIRKPDELEQLVACSRALTEDIRQIASFIQGNGLLLFKKEQQSGSEWGEEYDYVSLDSRESMAKNHAEILKDLPQSLRKGYDNCVKHADAIAFDNDHKSAGLDADDKQLLTFYATQIVTHHTNLTHAIDAFIKTVEHNQPPKIFLAHGKFVVLSAHKLVLIGDTVYKNVSCREIKEGALNCANALADALASSVNKTKQAAMQFPSVTAVQEMVDSIVDISHAAKALKVCLVQAAVPL